MKELTSDISLQFKIAAMEEPKMYYQRSKEFPGEVALMAQFFPTFEPAQPQDEICIQDTGDQFEENEVDDSIEEGEKKYIFYFLVDRSGSMTGSNMKTTKDALKLFIQSLP